jgi:hypothetical protein
MKQIIIVALALSTALSTTVAQAQDLPCLTPNAAFAMARSERPSTEITAQYDGAQAAAILEMMNTLATADVPTANQVTVLRSLHSSDVLLFGATEDGCLSWRGQFPKGMFEKAVWKAIGLPI